MDLLAVTGSKKKYSVLMSVYRKDNSEYLSQSIKSMINQTIMPDEFVIIKDGPLSHRLDKTIENFISDYPGLFNIVTLKENIGLGLALNEGLYLCKNELVARMDSDDISLPERCELQLREFAADETLDIVGTMIDEFDNDPSRPTATRILPLEHEKIKKFARRRSGFNHVSVMYKRSKVLSCQGYSDLRRNQDVDLFARMLYMGCRAKNIKRSLVMVRSNKELLKRRKSWENTRSYIKVIYNLWRIGFSSFFDFIVVTVAQCGIFISPTWLQNWIYKSFLRK